MRLLIFRCKNKYTNKWEKERFCFNKKLTSNDNLDLKTIGQFTGLFDKNDKPIYEGDIVDMTGEWWDAAGPAGHNSPIAEVKWDKDFCGFVPFANYDCDCGVYIEASGCKIIGNIYDNPELLKGEE